MGGWAEGRGGGATGHKACERSGAIHESVSIVPEAWNIVGVLRDILNEKKKREDFTVAVIVKNHNNENTF